MMRKRSITKDGVERTATGCFIGIILASVVVLLYSIADTVFLRGILHIPVVHP